MRKKYLLIVVLGMVAVGGLTFSQLAAQPANGDIDIPKLPAELPTLGDLEIEVPTLMPPADNPPALKTPELKTPALKPELPPVPVRTSEKPIGVSPLPPGVTGTDTPTKPTLPALPPVKQEEPKLQLPKVEPVREVPKMVPPTLPDPKPVAQPEVNLKPVLPTPKPVEQPQKPTEPTFSKAAFANNGFAADNRVTPTIAIETLGPDAVPQGKDLSYLIVVKNIGPIPVSDVRVEEQISQGNRYLGGDPVADVNLNQLRWSLGKLNVGEEKKIKVNVKPLGDRDYETSPRVTFTAEARNKVTITRPKLTATMNGPESVFFGDEGSFHIVIKNEGSAPANKVKIHVAMTPGLRHASQKDGSPVEAELDSLPPGESRAVVLKTTALEPGIQTCELTVLGDLVAPVKLKSTTMVQQPKLDLKMITPGKALVRGEATFTLELSNSGNATTDKVQAAAAFPEGLEFVSASDGGNYEPGTRTVTWNLGAQPAGSAKKVTVTARAGIAGNLAVRSIAQAGTRLQSKAECLIQVDGVPAVNFEIINVDNPAEVGKEITYEVRVINQGTSPLTNLRLVAGYSEGLQVGDIQAPVKYTSSGAIITFEPIPRLGVKADAVVRIKVKGTKPGDMRCKVQLSCDQIRQPVTKEDSTIFYQR
ncbi:MAG: hypothetical protein R3B84_24350 [Zavarzinella sp.]